MRSLELRAELAAALDRASCPRSVHTFLGRFAAYASAPTPVQPSQWFGRDLADMEASSKEDVNEMLRLLFEAYNDVVTSLEERRFVATPLPEDEEAVREWCEGYFEAACTDDVWMRDPEAVNLLSGIAVLAGERNARGEEPSETLLAECRESLYIFAAGFHEHFADARRAAAEEIAQQRGDADTYRREEPKVGRNAPCPCGSGKKFKRCCGNPATLH